MKNTNIYKKHVLKELRNAQVEAKSSDTKWINDEDFWVGIEDPFDEQNLQRILLNDSLEDMR